MDGIRKGRIAIRLGGFVKASIQAQPMFTE